MPPKPKRRPPQVKQLELDESDGSEELRGAVKGIQSNEGFLLEDDNSERENSDVNSMNSSLVKKTRKITQDIKLNFNEPTAL